jgi:hypothetical protein
MRPTYADLEMLLIDAGRDDRAADMPLLGFLAGLAIALPLWTAVAWLFWTLID